MQIGPVRWIFIKSPTIRRPYIQIRKIYEIELANSKANTLSSLKKKELLALREKTKLILKKKQQREVLQNFIALFIILVLAVILVSFFT